MNETFNRLVAGAREAGADRAAVIPADRIVTDTQFRAMCEANSCGVYGKCYMCPPYVGEIEDLIASLKNYDHVLVYQQVSPLEDSFDVEGMTAARKRMFALNRPMRRLFEACNVSHVLHLTAGACGICAVCAAREGLPCRAPELATSSLEAYGIHVSRLAESAGMKYINGVNTVTYFGAVLFSLKGE